MALFFTTMGLRVITQSRFRATPKILTPGRATPESFFSPFSEKSQGTGPIFRLRYTGTPKARQG